MSVNSFIPEIWSAQIFSDYQNLTVFGGLVNRDYEGEITGQGDTVRINSVGPITVNTYTKNSTSNLTVQDLTDAQTVLVIDKSKYFAFQLDDIDAVQTKPKIMAKAQENAGRALAEDVDSIIADCYSEAGATITSTACGPTAITEVIAKIGEKMDQNNVPKQGRYMVVPPWFEKNLVQAQIMKWIGLPAGSAPSGAASAGYVGSALGFDFYMSNMLNETTASGSTGYQHYVMAFNRDAITFANQLTKLEAYRPEGKFADALKGLNVYGLKVVQPKALVCAILTDSTV